MKIVVILLILTGLIAIYVTWLRPWLREQPWAQGFFTHPVIEWMELKLWAKSESILWARWQQFLGIVLAVTGALGGIDWSAVAILTPDYIDPFLPAAPLILNVLGTIAEALRRDTTKPLEVVALPAEKPPEVIAAVARVDAATAAARVVVEDEREKGAL